MASSTVPESTLLGRRRCTITNGMRPPHSCFDALLPANPIRLRRQPSFISAENRLITAQEHSVSKGPEKEPNRRDEEGSSDPIQWQKNDGGEEGPRSGRDIETDTQGKSDPDSSRS